MSQKDQAGHGVEVDPKKIDAFVCRQMTPSQQAKAAGLKSLLQVSELTGVCVQTLTNWHKNKPALYAVVIAGCVSITEKIVNSESGRDDYGA